MAIIDVATRSQARAIHVQQIINWLRGNPEFSEPVSFTGITSSAAYALSAKNSGTGGLAFAARSSSNVVLLEAKNAGVIVRPNDPAGIPFRVRNFLDSADLFSVDASGAVSIGLTGTVVTTAGVQALTNKTLTAPIIDGGVINTYAELINQAGPPANPVSGRIRVYETSDSLRHVNNAGVVRVLATLDGPETLLAKSLTTPSLTGPVVTNYADFNQGGAPSAPASGVNRLYAVAGPLLRFIHSGGTKELVDTDSVQTLTNKTLNFSSSYVGLAFGASPGGTASANRIWTDGSNVYYTTPSGSIVTLLSSSNTPTVAALGFARSVMTGAIG